MSPPQTHRDGLPLGLLSVAIMGFLSAFLLFECGARCQTITTLPEAIGRLQPRLTAKSTRTWAHAIQKATAPHNIDPFLVAAMVMRESSYRPSVASGRELGRLGEVGPLQIHGVALRFADPGCKTGQWCWLRTGVNFLAHHKRTCPGSTWRWLGSYGMTRCPSESKARAHHSTLKAFYYYKIARPGVTTWSETASP